jgi:hypothetical protein
MNYNIEDIEKILGFTSWSIKRKIDTFLEIDADMYCNMGKETPKTHKEETKKKSKKIYHAIKKVDSKLGEKLLYHMD